MGGKKQETELEQEGKVQGLLVSFPFTETATKQQEALDRVKESMEETSSF